MDNAIPLAAADLETLQCAYEHLEHPSLAARMTNFVGLPIERGLRLLPQTWYSSLHDGSRKVMASALAWAIDTLDAAPGRASGERYHKFMSAASGALGGFFGLPAVLAELPVSTTITLRAIADIARAEGENLAALDTRLACVEVLALGGRTDEDDAAETGYYGIRVALALHLSRVPEKVLENSILKPSHPALVELVAAIAARFGITVTEKAAVQMVPIVGALTGALVNVIFMQHFQDVAKAHFTVRRLERQYGAELVRAEYERFNRIDRR